MPLPIDPPIRFRPRGQPQVEFATFEDAKVWATRETKAWNPWNSASFGQPLNGWRDEILQVPQSVLGAADQALQQPNNPAGLSTHAGNIRGLVQQYEGGPAIAADSSDGERLRMIFNEGQPQTAIFEAGAIVNARSLLLHTVANGHMRQIDAGAVISAYVRTVVASDGTYQRRVAAAAASQDAILAEFERKLDARLEAFKRETSKLFDAKEALRLQIEGDKAKHSQFRSSVATALKRARGDFRAIKHTYETQMMLGAPATYWQKRARNSNIIAMLAFGGFVLVGVVAGYIVHSNLSTLHAWITDPSGKVDAAAILALSPLVIIGLWLFRFFTRLYGTAVTEAVDAGQRKVMVTTFLAIMSDRNTKLSDAERILILQALFRQGGAKDESDSMPATAVEAIVKAVQGKT